MPNPFDISPDNIDNEPQASIRDTLHAADRDLSEAFILAKQIEDLLGFKEPITIQAVYPADMTAQVYDISKKARLILKSLQFAAERLGA